jgi:TRAP-type C4-dicarboxylate transport system substrate-binding protein
MQTLSGGSNMLKISPQLAGLGLAMALLVPAPAQAEATYSTILTPDHPQTVYAGYPWADAIRERTGGAVDIKIYPGGSILPADGILRGMAEGVADSGFITAGFVPAEMPLWAAIGDMGWKKPNMHVITMAATEFGLLDEYGSRDWVNNNVVFGGTLSTTDYVFHCKGEPKSLADFQGLQVRTPGNAWARFVEYIGAVPVNLVFAEVYPALERGAIDCAAFDKTQIIEAARTGEVVDSLNMLAMGPFFAQATWAFNEQFWASLTPDQRRVIFEENARAMARYLVVMETEVVIKHIEGGKKLGLAFNEPAADLQAKYDEFVAAGIGGLAEIAKERGVPDYEQGFAHFETLLTKWESLLQGVDVKDEEALYQLIMTNIYDKLDPATYRVE